MNNPEELLSKTFENPQEEIEFLKEELARRVESAPVVQQPEQVARDMIHEYRNPSSDQTPISQTEVHRLNLRLSPEPHDSQVLTLFEIMKEKGVRDTLLVLEGLKNPHLEDDFHRFLVQYLADAESAPQRVPSQLLDELDVILFSISVPMGDDPVPYHELAGTMEQLIAGLYTHQKPDTATPLTFEIALPAGTDEVAFYISVPRPQAGTFEKQVIALYPRAIVQPAYDDYNIFIPGSSVTGAYAESKSYDVLECFTYEHFTTDPFSVLLNTFSKLKTHEEGAAIQIVLGHTKDSPKASIESTLKLLSSGKSLREAFSKSHESFGSAFGSALKDVFFGSSSSSDSDNPLPEQPSPESLSDAEKVRKKLERQIAPVTFRIAASAENPERSQEILHDLSSAFHQYDNPNGNGLSFSQTPDKQISSFVRGFSFREYDPSHSLRLNYRELATLYHFPFLKTVHTQLKQSVGQTAPAPLDLPQQGTLLGINSYRGDDRPVHITEADRMRHMYIIGQTGTGKTGLMVNMAVQDIQAGHGVCFVDPHGSDIQYILSTIPPERLDDVIYFDPAYIPRPMGLNMLEFDSRFPEQKTLIIDELMGIFNQLFDMQKQGGAMFQQYFKNSAFLVMDHPESGNTLLEITRVLGDSEFRRMKLEHCTNPIVRQFWENAEKTTGDQSLSNFVPYISSKFDPLISNEILRPVIIQERSAFSVRDLMDSRKILLVNLSKGRLGELNANLLGLILVGKIQMAALSRADQHGFDFPPFYLYIDEFQNVTTPSIASILSEARKYKLSLTVAHQYLNQLSPEIKNAVLGNVGSMALFRISPEDATQLVPRIEPTFAQRDLISLENRHAIVSLLLNGHPAQPFTIKTADYIPGNSSRTEEVKQASYMRYGRDRAEVEAEIMQRYSKT